MRIPVYCIGTGEAKYENGGGRISAEQRYTNIAPVRCKQLFRGPMVR
jgi:hypothetical protein